MRKFSAFAFSILMVSVTAVGYAARADDYSSELAIPTKNDADQDEIAKEKASREDVSDDDAQNRRAPKKESYTQLRPDVEAAPAPKLKEKLKDGTKQYEVNMTPQNYSGGLRVGPYSPTDLIGTSGNTYQQIYGNSPAIMLDFSYEYQFFKHFGKLGIKGDLSMITAKGNGVFEHPALNPNIGTDVALETIQFVGLPVVASLVYRMQYWDKQPFIPYVEGGAGYFTLLEVRNDLPSISQDVRYGGSPIGQAAGGLQIMLDRLDKEVMWQLNQEYGISHIYLAVDFREMFQLGGEFNFGASVVEGGFLFEF